MKVAIANDHGGFHLKDRIISHLHENSIDICDLGTHNAFESADYPDYAEKVGLSVIKKEVDLGILCCGTGIGMSIAANKIPGIRAAVVGDVFSAQRTRAHNDTNILCLGERVIGEDLALMILDVWLNTSFEEGRHQRRVDKISKIERAY